MTEAVPRRPLSPDALEARLREIGAERYHHLHPFHRLLHAGRCTPDQIRAWALNRYYYQSRIPMKDAALMSRIEDPDLRRAWRRRVVDHDGSAPGEGGIERWLRLTDALGFERDYVAACEGVLPATRFAVEAYLRFVRERTLVEAVASSLTELFAPGIIRDRVAGMLEGYGFIDRGALSYFGNRLTEAPRDADHALAFVKAHARTAETQDAVLAALRFKCDVLWSQLDALHLAYVEPCLVPPGAWRPGDGLRAGTAGP